MKNTYINIMYLWIFLIFIGICICLLFCRAVPKNKQSVDNTIQSIDSTISSQLRQAWTIIQGKDDTTQSKIPPKDHYTPFIIMDKDGYTNIREQPNTKSKIIGKVYKYQLFFSIDDLCGSNMFATDQWEPICSVGNPDGYIYRKNILQLNNLPLLKGKQDFKLSSDNSATIVIANDSIQITMLLQPYNRQNHQGWIYGGSGDEYEKHIVLQQIDTEIKEVEVFDNNNVKTEIKEIEIIYNGQKKILPKDKIYNYCDPKYIAAYVGFDGEIYLGISGGGDTGIYRVWFSIVKGNIVYQNNVHIC